MFLDNYRNKKDKVVKENRLFKISQIAQSVTILALAYSLIFKIDAQRTIVVPPFVTLKEFWISGENVSDSYLEMVADGVAFNILNVSAERKPNTEFIYALTPSEYYNKVKTAIEKQIKFIQNNGVSQVFYTTNYDVSQKGLIKVKGVLKQFIGDKKMDSALNVLEISYYIKGSRFWITGIDIKPENASRIKEEE